MDKKMDNVNFVSTSSIFDNLNLHAKPTDSSIKNGMDAKKDLEMHQKDGEEEQKWMESIQKISSSVQEKTTVFSKTSKTNNIEGEWGHDRYYNSMGCPMSLVYDQYLKGRSLGSLSAPNPAQSSDNPNRTSTRKTASNDKRLLEIKSEENYQPCNWCVNYRSQQGRQERIVPNPTKERQIPTSSGSIWKSGTETSRLGVRELLGNECLDLFMPVGTRSGNQFTNNIGTEKNNNETMQKLPSYPGLVEKLKKDREFREFCRSTDEWLFNQENSEYFDKTYGITCIHPLLVDYSGMVVLFLDVRGIMFKWSEMEYGMDILGINIVEGLANYLYHPEKICTIMKDTGKLVPEVELIRRVKEKMAKEKSWA